MSEAPSALAIVGPTASGKTGLAVAVARALDGEVISLDSRQAYRGFRVGTAAPGPDDLAAAPHHGVGFLDPSEPYGAGRFARLARGWIGDIRARGQVPILAGGTGLFLRALTDPVFAEPPIDPDRRRRLRKWVEAHDPDLVRRWADRLDPELAARLASVDRQRASRTIELALFTGRPLSWFIDHGEPEHPPLELLIYAIELPSEELRSRIASRASDSLRAWLDEVRELRDRNLGGSAAFESLGYQDVLALEEGRLEREEALERIVSDTWAYARRQRTWFRHQLPAEAVRLDGSQATGQLARRIARDWRSAVET